MPTSAHLGYPHSHTQKLTQTHIISRIINKPFKILMPTMAKLDEAELPCPAATEQQVQFTADAEPSWDKHVENPGQLPDSHTKTVSLAV